MIKIIKNKAEDRKGNLLEESKLIEEIKKAGFTEGNFICIDEDSDAYYHWKEIHLEVKTSDEFKKVFSDSKNPFDVWGSPSDVISECMSETFYDYIREASPEELKELGIGIFTNDNWEYYIIKTKEVK